MKALVITILLGTSLGHAQTLVRWVGSLPPAQVSSAVELVNQELRGRIQLEYTMDEKAVARIVSGDLSDGYDLVQMKDAEMLNAAAQEGAIQAIPSWGSLTLRETLRDPALRWVGLLKRHRIIYYDSNKVNPADIPTYESLANPRFQGKLCLRQVKSQYNVGLYSFFLALWGEQKMREVLAGWARNSESQPLIEKDLDGVIARIANGDCEVGVANTYYYLRHLDANPKTTVRPHLPNRGGIGAHVNVDGVALLSNSRHFKSAAEVIHILITPRVQLALSQSTGKHPANASVVNPVLDRVFGPIEENRSFDLNRIGVFKDHAVKIATEAGLK